MTEQRIAVRVAVAVDSSGHWNALGWCCDSEANIAELAVCGLPDSERAEAKRDPATRIHWLTAELPVPPPFAVEVAATVESPT